MVDAPCMSPVFEPNYEPKQKKINIKSANKAIAANDKKAVS